MDLKLRFPAIFPPAAAMHWPPCAGTRHGTRGRKRCACLYRGTSSSVACLTEHLSLQEAGAAHPVLPCSQRGGLSVVSFQRPGRALL